MHQILKSKGFTDTSPFQWARMTYLAQRVDENYQKLVTLRKNYAGRMDSGHLLFKILQNLNVEFKGDLEAYMSQCDQAAKRLCGVLGITSSFSRGRLFTEGHFYPECPEIILYTRSNRWSGMDLWRDWRSVTPIEVITHPITTTQVMELGVMDEIRIPQPDIAIVTIDIPLLAAQYVLWKAGNPDKTLEAFVTTVPMVGMIKSHLNVAFFNKVLAEMGIKPECVPGVNVPFAQTPTDIHADQLVQEILDKVPTKAMSGTQILSSIPMLYGKNYLTEVQVGDTTPTFQILWALIAQKMEALALVLEMGKRTGYDRLLQEITQIRRGLIQIEQDNILSNGLSTAAGISLLDRLKRLVIDRLPNA